MGSIKSSIALTNANDDVIGVKVILNLFRMILIKYSFIKPLFLGLKFCNREKPGIETLNFAVERLIYEENEKKWKRTM
jgi:hypothetical protein